MVVIASNWMQVSTVLTDAATIALKPTWISFTNMVSFLARRTAPFAGTWEGWRCNLGRAYRRKGDSWSTQYSCAFSIQAVLSQLALPSSSCANPMAEPLFHPQSDEAPSRTPRTPKAVIQVILVSDVEWNVCSVNALSFTFSRGKAACTRACLRIPCDRPLLGAPRFEP